MAFLAMIFTGLLAGLVARAVVPGRQAMGLLATIALGVVGSLVGGFVGSLIDHSTRSSSFHLTGLVFSSVGAVIVLVLVQWVGGRRLSAR